MKANRTNNPYGWPLVVYYILEGLWFLAWFIIVVLGYTLTDEFAAGMRRGLYLQAFHLGVPAAMYMVVEKNPWIVLLIVGGLMLVDIVAILDAVYEPTVPPYEWFHVAILVTACVALGITVYALILATVKVVRAHTRNGTVYMRIPPDGEPDATMMASVSASAGSEFGGLKDE